MVRGSIYDHFLVNRPHEAIVLRIEKDANTLFADFLCSLSRNHAASVNGPMHHRLPSLRTAAIANGDDIVPTALASDAWTRAVFIAIHSIAFFQYLSKCVPGHDVDTRMCGHVFPGAGYQPSLHSLSTPPAAMDGHRPRRRTATWKLQSRFCDGLLLRPHEHYHLVMPLDRYTTGTHTAEMMRRAGWTQPSDEPIYRYYFGQEQHDDGRHATDADRRRRQYYTSAAMVTSVLRFTAPDYQAFNISVPAWASNMVGDRALSRSASGATALISRAPRRQRRRRPRPRPPRRPHCHHRPTARATAQSATAAAYRPASHAASTATAETAAVAAATHAAAAILAASQPNTRRLLSLHRRRSGHHGQRPLRGGTPVLLASLVATSAEAAGCWRCSGFGARCVGDAAAGRA